jgi:membrane-bound serine protease (ClpP class)
MDRPGRRRARNGAADEHRSSTPISVGGGHPEDLRRKVVDDAAADLRSLMPEHGATPSGRTRRFARPRTHRTRALAQNVIDFVAPDLPTLLEDIDGYRTVPKGFVLDTAGAAVTTVEMSLWDRILDTIVDPNIIVLLMSLGCSRSRSSSSTRDSSSRRHSARSR